MSTLVASESDAERVLRYPDSARSTVSPPASEDDVERVLRQGSGKPTILLMLIYLFSPKSYRRVFLKSPPSQRPETQSPSTLRLVYSILAPKFNVKILFVVTLVLLSLVAQRWLNLKAPQQEGLVSAQLASSTRSQFYVSLEPDAVVSLYKELLFLQAAQLIIDLIQDLMQDALRRWAERNIMVWANDWVMGLGLRFVLDKASTELQESIGMSRMIPQMIEYLVIGIMPQILDLVLTFVYVGMRGDIQTITLSITICIVSGLVNRLAAKYTKRKEYHDIFRALCNRQAEALRPAQYKSNVMRGFTSDVSSRIMCTLDEMMGAEATFQTRSKLVALLLSSCIFIATRYAMFKQLLRAASGQLSLQGYFAGNALLSQVERNIRQVLKSYSYMLDQLQDIERPRQLAACQPDIFDSPGAEPLTPLLSGPQIEIRDLCHSANGRVLFKNLSFTIQPGQKAVIIGVSGTGKSTLVNFLPRLINPDDGNISINGEDIKHFTLESLRRAFAVIDQDTALCAGTVAFNVKYGCEPVSDEEMIRACQLADIHNDLMEMENGYQTLVTEDGANFSKGQQQRMRIANLVLQAKDRKIAILDEITSALDTRTEGRVMENLEPVLKSMTCLIITHRLATIQAADVVFELENQCVTQRERFWD